MITLSFIHRHLSTLAEGELITTRDLLHAGPRREVDHAVAKCIKQGWIVRVARGVFVRTISTFILPTLEAVAEIKARSFGRDIRINGSITATKQGLTPFQDDREVHSFYIDGSSSSFIFLEQTEVHFRKASKKILRLVDEGPGLAVRAIMSLGSQTFKLSHLEKLKPLWNNRDGRALLARSRQWMHAWLSDLFQSNKYCGPGGFNQATDIIDDPDYLGYKEWSQRRAESGLLDGEGDADELSFWSGEGDDLIKEDAQDEPVDFLESLQNQLGVEVSDQELYSQIFGDGEQDPFDDIFDGPNEDPAES